MAFKDITTVDIFPIYFESKLAFIVFHLPGCEPISSSPQCHTAPSVQYNTHSPSSIDMFYISECVCVWGGGGGEWSGGRGQRDMWHRVCLSQWADDSIEVCCQVFLYGEAELSGQVRYKRPPTPPPPPPPPQQMVSVSGKSNR